MSGMLGVEELNIINSKIDKIHENVISEESQVWTGAIQDTYSRYRYQSGQNCQAGRKSSPRYPGRLRLHGLCLRSEERNNFLFNNSSQTLIVPETEQFVSIKNHVPCSCSLLSVLLSLLGDHKVGRAGPENSFSKNFPAQANKLFSQNFCVSPLEFNGLTMAEMLLR